MSAIIEALKSSLDAAPHNWQCRLGLVEALLAESRAEEAQEVLQDIEELPVDLDERVQAARAYGLVDPASGMEVLDGILSEMPSFAKAHHEKAQILLREKDFENAKKHYYTAATFDPDLADPDLEAQFGIQQNATPAEPVSVEPVSVEPVAAKPTSEASFEEGPVAIAESTETQAPAPLVVEADSSPSSETPPLPPQESLTSAPEPIHSVPVVSLREASDYPKPQPLINPELIPELPSLAYEESPTYQQAAYTPEDVYLESLGKVELHPKKLPEPVLYDYTAPDDSLFEPSLTDEDIFVGATYDETGARIDDLFENLHLHQKEQAEQIAATEKRDKVNAFVVAAIAMTAICALLVMIVAAVPQAAPPQILVNAPLPNQDDSLETAQLNKPELQKQPMPSSASAMSMEVMEVSAFSEMSMPVFDNPGLTPGMASIGNDFGMSVSFGDTGGGGAMFFGGRSSGQRYLFVLDHSASMKPHQVKLRDNELERTLKGLRGVKYHIMLFAGGAYYVDKGWQAANKQPTKWPTVFESPGGKYSFKDNGLFDFKLQGDPKDFPSPRWLTATPSNIRRSLEEVRTAKKFGGTDWDNALMLAHLMDPPPDVIFFMTDGIDRQIDTSQIVRNSRGNGAPKINCVAMQTTAAQEQFAEIAKRTNGSYTIVDKDGKPIDGFKFMKNPKDFEGRL